MDIGFFYESKKDSEDKTRVLLYYKKEAFDVLAGLIYPVGIDEETFNSRVEVAVRQSMDKLCESVPAIDNPKGVEGELRFYSEKKDVPESVEGWVSLVESIGKDPPVQQLPGYA